ncbi:endolytic transglycosylase MltG [Paenibacillus beijingensis]|uniref:endolytic transglycosylase MltG n=1 Tax=Paenibacillus beijingensis TaxID=1126833 RepID=UPI003B75D375
MTVLIGIMLATAGGIALYVWNGLRPAPAGDVKRIEVAKGSTAFQVADLLEKQGIIRNSFIFKYYLKFHKEGGAFLAGTYDLAPGMTHDAIISKLNKGETVKAETIRFTIPEGFTLLQIADKLSSEGLVDKATFIQLADSKRKWPDSEAAGFIPEQVNYKHLLEGYLFPETYEMKVGSTEEEIIDRMLSELDRKLNELPDDWEETLQKRQMSLHQLLTVASLVEREVVVDQERPIVAGVIYNRLAKPMRLQIDATVQYLLDKPKERLYEKDLTVEDPYNTYRYDGLPPGPIANPSLKSIEAALYPDSNDYYYYVTKKDGTQQHLFAKTFRQHEQNIRKSNAEAKGGE